MENYIILGLLLHFLADFGLQTNEQAVNKSKDNVALIQHTGVYSLVWLVAMLSTVNFTQALLFAMITFVAHTITDYITSRIVKKFFSINDYHNGFVVIGFDQLTHYIQLLLTYKFIMNV